jgi:hypothetical protein
MQKKKQETLFEQWELLMRAARKFQTELRGVAPFRDAFEQAYSRACFNRRRRDVARAAAKQATRELQESMDTAFDAAAALRGFIKSVLGFRSEKLREFGMKPRKSGGRSRKKQPPGFELPS